MNSTVKKYFDFSVLAASKSWLNHQPDYTDTPNKSMDLILGIAIAAIAFPIVTLTIMVGAFFSQEKWEEFWDSFL